MFPAFGPPNVQFMSVVPYVATPAAFAPAHRSFHYPHDALCSYLPAFAPQYFRNTDPINSIIENWYLPNYDTSRSYWNPIPETSLRDILQTIFDAASVAQRQGRKVVPSTSRRLRVELEDCWEEDENAGLPVSRHSLNLFRSLADVSSRARSRHIGRVLCEFFLDHAKALVRDESAKSMVHWCAAIMVARMAEGDKGECFETLVTLRPEVVDEIEGEAGVTARNVASCLASIASDASPRSRRWYRKPMIAALGEEITATTTSDMSS